MYASISMYSLAIIKIKYKKNEGFVVLSFTTTTKTSWYIETNIYTVNNQNRNNNENTIKCTKKNTHTS